MRKGITIAVSGIFIVTTVMLCSANKTQIYEKKRNFKTTDEIINVLNTEPLAGRDSNKPYGELVYSDSLKECLSKRKRMTSGLMDYGNNKLQVDNERDNEEEKKKIVNDYFNKLRNVKKLDKPKKYEAIPLIGKAKMVRYPGDSDEWIDMKISMVLIDEGEGWVIDYIMYER